MAYPRRLGEDRQVFQKATFIDDDTTLTVRDRVVVGDGSLTATLPPVADAVGMTFTFANETGDTATLTIEHAGDSVDWSNITLADTKTAVLMSDGRRWHTLLETT